MAARFPERPIGTVNSDGLSYRQRGTPGSSSHEVAVQPGTHSDLISSGFARSVLEDGCLNGGGTGGRCGCTIGGAIGCDWVGCDSGADQ